MTHEPHEGTGVVAEKPKRAIPTSHLAAVGCGLAHLLLGLPVLWFLLGFPVSLSITQVLASSPAFNTHHSFVDALAMLVVVTFLVSTVGTLIRSDLCVLLLVCVDVILLLIVVILLATAVHALGQPLPQPTYNGDDGPSLVKLARVAVLIIDIGAAAVLSLLLFISCSAASVLTKQKWKHLPKGKTVDGTSDGATL